MSLCADLSVAREPRFDEHATRTRGGADTRLFFAPGRVNLMGAHLDYNGGPVLPMAIDRGTVVAARPRTDRRLVLASTREARVVEHDLARLEAALADGSAAPSRSGEAAWADYPLGVALALLRRLGPGVAQGVELHFGGDLPVGAGLSSSASITLATAVALDSLWGVGVDVPAAIEAALWAEREFVGVQCGIMDPFAVGHARPGRVLVLDCKDATWDHVPLPAGMVVGVVDTLVRRELARGEFNVRVAQCQAAFEGLAPHAPGAACLAEVPLAVLERHGGALDPVVARRARHVLEETARTWAARDALVAGDAAAFGACMFAAHTSLRDLYEVSIPELDTLVAAARGVEGVHGSRLTGAGFGGCAVAVMQRGTEEAFARAVRAAFREAYEREPRVAFYSGSPGLGEVTPVSR